MRLSRKLNRLLKYPRFVAPFAGRGWLSFDLRNPDESELLQLTAYYPEIWERVTQVFEHQEVVWDVGAGFGAFGVQAVWDPTVKEVHCFEADPGDYSALQMNQRLNEGKLYLHPFTLTTESEVRIYRRESAEYPVQCIPLDEVMRKRLAPLPTFLKIRGVDQAREVLNGAKEMLKSRPPKGVLVEAESQERLAPGLEKEFFPEQNMETTVFRYRSASGRPFEVILFTRK